MVNEQDSMVGEAVLALRLRQLADVLERPPASTEDDVAFTDVSGLPELVVMASDHYSAEHYRVFCHELVPAASVFLEPRGMMGGQVSTRVWLEMNAAQFEPDTSSILADHLVNLFRFYAYALDTHQRDLVSTSIYQHVYSWLPVFLDVLARMNAPEANVIGRWIEHTVCELAPIECKAAVSLPDLPPTHFSLEDAHTGLVSISIFLSTHAESGLFIPKSRLAEVARNNRLPTGFGSRSQMIEGLLRSASGYDAIPAVSDFLMEEVAFHLAVWNRWESKGARRWATQWREKLRRTTTVLESIRQAM